VPYLCLLVDEIGIFKNKFKGRGIIVQLVECGFGWLILDFCSSLSINYNQSYQENKTVSFLMADNAVCSENDMGMVLKNRTFVLLE